MARLLSGGSAQKPPSRKSSFSLQTGSESRLPPAHPSDVDSQGGLLAAAGRALRGRGSGQVGTLAPSNEQGLRTEGSRVPVPPRAEGRDPRVDWEVRMKGARTRDSLEERDEDAKKNKSKPIKGSATSRVAVTQRCSALSVNELQSTFSRRLGRDGSSSSPPQPIAFARLNQPT